MLIAYILDVFPKVSETFVLDEILHVRKFADVRVFAFSNPGESVVHPRVSSVAVSYRGEPSLIKSIGAHCYYFARANRRYLRSLMYAIDSRNQIAKLFLYHLDWVREIELSGVRICHAHFGNRASNMAMLVNLLTEIPYTFTTHRYDIFDKPPSNYRLKSHLAAAHVTISDYNMRYIIDHFGVEPNKLRIIHCGVDTDAPQGVHIKKADSIEYRIVCVARHEPVKAIDTLLRVIKELDSHSRPLRCDLVGDGPERGRLESLAADLGISGKVVFHGLLPQDRVREVVTSADIMVLPSRSEGIPVSLMEAMLWGVPVIGPRVNGVPELVVDGVNGYLFNPADMMELRSKIESMIDDPSTARRFIEAARRTVLEQFSRDKETAKLIEIWRSELS